MNRDFFKKGNYDIMLGIVAEDKKFDSRNIKVYCPEIFPFETDLIVKQSDFAIDLTDKITGNPIQDTISITNVIEAEYLDMNTNRVGPPDVVKEEQVMVFHYADTDAYYWYPAGRDDNLRLPEHMRIAVSDDQKRVKVLNTENSYFIEMDTLHSKSITIQTAKSDGEKYVYTFKFDSSENVNTATMKDDDGNEFWIESDTPRVVMKNKLGTTMDCNKEDAYIIAPNDVVIKAGNQIVLNSKTLTMLIDDVIKFTTKAFGLDSPTISMKGDTIGLDGAVAITKALLSGHHQAPSRSIGPAPSPYAMPETDIGSGGGSGNASSPNSGNGGANNRTMAAYEQLYEAFDLVIKTIQGLKDGDGDKCTPPGTISSILPKVEESLMPKSKGDPKG